jgi:hypothetical protein
MITPERDYEKEVDSKRNRWTSIELKKLHAKKMKLRHL